jgi:hypothetical protein
MIKEQINFLTNTYSNFTAFKITDGAVNKNRKYTCFWINMYIV